MNCKLLIAAALLAATGANADVSAPPATKLASAPALSVDFVDPQHFTDASFSYDHERERSIVLRGIEQHLRQLAATGLPPGRSLDIRILDVDLAGQFEPWRARTANVRIVREIGWPRIALHYTLRDADGVLASGEEQVVDMSFLRSTNLYDRDDRLRYEKAMLDDWFERRIAAE